MLLLPLYCTTKQGQQDLGLEQGDGGGHGGGGEGGGGGESGGYLVAAHAPTPSQDPAPWFTKAVSETARRVKSFSQPAGFRTFQKLSPVRRDFSCMLNSTSRQ